MNAALSEPAISTLDQHQALIESLLKLQPASAKAKRFETHAASIILTADLAYKIKKPLNLGFLDYSSLAKRAHFCAEEIRLNQRLAAQIYLSSVPITGSLSAPRIDGFGQPIEWAVKMRRFDPKTILSKAPEQLGRGLMDKLAEQLANFHTHAAVSWEGSRYGTPDAIYSPMVQNFTHLEKSLSKSLRHDLHEIAAWTESHLRDLSPLIEERRPMGRIRECHGDLHLGNIALINGQPVITDGIEFDPALRWIDVINDLAFLTMDLTRIGRVDLARRLLNTYLEETGDYPGLPLLRFYEVYRAMVRAKVNAIRLGQNLTLAEKKRLEEEIHRYLRLAEGLSRQGLQAIILTQGVTASGKSTLAQSLSEHLPAIVIRSDVERKRIAGIPKEQRLNDRFHLDLYSADMTDQTYARLAELAESVVHSGFIAVVDATFLQRKRRRHFHDLANRLDVPFVILSCDAPEAELKSRLTKRVEMGVGPSDADLNVLKLQLAKRESLSRDEMPWVIQFNPEKDFELDDLVQRLHP